MYDNRHPLILWHGAQTPLHRRVALAAFLGHALEYQWPIYTARDDPAFADLRAAAPPGRLIVIGSPSMGWQPTTPWIWIGTHGMAPTCTQLRRERNPPTVILCLAMSSAPGLPAPQPPDHQIYITGQSWT